MAAAGADPVIRVAGADDVAAIAALRSTWTAGAAEDPDFERRLAAWLVVEGDRRTIWLAAVDGSEVGMASVLEYRRMPRPAQRESRWGYISNMFVRESFRGSGIGSALLATIITVTDGRGYARLVLAPSPEALGFYRRAGFVVPDDSAGKDRLLVRPAAAGQGGAASP